MFQVSEFSEMLQDLSFSYPAVKLKCIDRVHVITNSSERLQLCDCLGEPAERRTQLPAQHTYHGYVAITRFYGILKSEYLLTY